MLMLSFSEDMVNMSVKCSQIGWKSFAHAFAYAMMSHGEVHPEKLGGGCAAHFPKP